MLHFYSTREKRLWGYALLTVLVIFTSLLLSREQQLWLLQPSIQVVLFLGMMLFVALTVVVHGLKGAARTTGRFVLPALLALGIALVFRLGAPERSHLLEFCILALFLYEALLERAQFRKGILPPALLAVLLATAIGVLDEGLQGLIPNRVLDPQDMWFNSLAAVGAIGSSKAIRWLKTRSKSPGNP